jgi:hypothetical protein
MSQSKFHDRVVSGSANGLARSHACDASEFLAEHVALRSGPGEAR